MTRTLELIRKLGLSRTAPEQECAPFDQRLQRLAGMQPTSVARAVLFRTRPSHQEA